MIVSLQLLELRVRIQFTIESYNPQQTEQFNFLWGEIAKAVARSPALGMSSTVKTGSNVHSIEFSGNTQNVLGLLERHGIMALLNPYLNVSPAAVSGFSNSSSSAVPQVPFVPTRALGSSVSVRPIPMLPSFLSPALSIPVNNERPDASESPGVLRLLTSSSVSSSSQRFMGSRLPSVAPHPLSLQDLSSHVLGGFGSLLCPDADPIVTHSVPFSSDAKVSVPPLSQTRKRQPKARGSDRFVDPNNLNLTGSHRHPLSGKIERTFEVSFSLSKQENSFLSNTELPDTVKLTSEEGSSHQLTCTFKVIKVSPDGIDSGRRFLSVASFLRCCGSTTSRIAEESYQFSEQPGDVCYIKVKGEQAIIYALISEQFLLKLAKSHSGREPFKNALRKKLAKNLRPFLSLERPPRSFAIVSSSSSSSAHRRDASEASVHLLPPPSSLSDHASMPPSSRRPETKGLPESVLPLTPAFSSLPSVSSSPFSISSELSLRRDDNSSSFLSLTSGFPPSGAARRPSPSLLRPLGSILSLSPIPASVQPSSLLGSTDSREVIRPVPRRPLPSSSTSSALLRSILCLSPIPVSSEGYYASSSSLPLSSNAGFRFVVPPQLPVLSASPLSSSQSPVVSGSSSSLSSSLAVSGLSLSFASRKRELAVETPNRVEGSSTPQESEDLEGSPLAKRPRTTSSLRVVGDLKEASVTDENTMKKIDKATAVRLYARLRSIRQMCEKEENLRKKIDANSQNKREATSRAIFLKLAKYTDEKDRLLEEIKSLQSDEHSQMLKKDILYVMSKLDMEVNNRFLSSSSIPSLPPKKHVKLKIPAERGEEIKEGAKRRLIQKDQESEQLIVCDREAFKDFITAQVLEELSDFYEKKMRSLYVRGKAGEFGHLSKIELAKLAEQKGESTIQKIINAVIVMVLKHEKYSITDFKNYEQMHLPIKEVIVKMKLSSTCAKECKEQLIELGMGKEVSLLIANIKAEFVQRKERLANLCMFSERTANRGVSVSTSSSSAGLRR